MLNGALANAPLGSTVTLRISSDQGPGEVLEVPLASVYDPGNGPGVWRIASRPATVSWQPVTVIGLNDETARVTGPLKPGEPSSPWAPIFCTRARRCGWRTDASMMPTGVSHERRAF